MDKISDKQVNKWIEGFVKKVNKKYKPEKILIFGSRSKGTNLLDSDLDILIVSKMFSGIGWLKRIADVSQLWDGMISLDALCYTPKEFEEKRKEICIVKEIAESSKPLKLA